MDTKFRYRGESDRYLDDAYWYAKFITLKVY